MHPACFGTRRYERFSQPSSASSFDVTRAHHLLQKYQSNGEDCFIQAVKPNIPQTYGPHVEEVMAPVDPAFSGYNIDASIMNKGFAWPDWPCMYSMPSPSTHVSMDYQSTPGQIIQSIVQLQGLSPREVQPSKGLTKTEAKA